MLDNIPESHKELFEKAAIQVAQNSREAVSNAAKRLADERKADFTRAGTTFAQYGIDLNATYPRQSDNRVEIDFGDFTLYTRSAFPGELVAKMRVLHSDLTLEDDDDYTGWVHNKVGVNPHNGDLRYIIGLRQCMIILDRTATQQIIRNTEVMEQRANRVAEREAKTNAVEAAGIAALAMPEESIAVELEQAVRAVVLDVLEEVGFEY